MHWFTAIRGLPCSHFKWISKLEVPRDVKKYQPGNIYMKIGAGKMRDIRRKFARWRFLVVFFRAYVSAGWLNHQLDVELCIFPLVWDLCVRKYIQCIYISFEWFKIEFVPHFTRFLNDSKREISRSKIDTGTKPFQLVEGFRKPSVDHLFGLVWHHKPSSFCSNSSKAVLMMDQFFNFWYMNTFHKWGFFDDFLNNHIWRNIFNKSQYFQGFLTLDVFAHLWSAIFGLDIDQMLCAKQDSGTVCKFRPPKIKIPATSVSNFFSTSSILKATKTNQNDTFASVKTMSFQTSPRIFSWLASACLWHGLGKKPPIFNGKTLNPLGTAFTDLDHLWSIFPWQIATKSSHFSHTGMVTNSSF